MGWHPRSGLLSLSCQQLCIVCLSASRGEAEISLGNTHWGFDRLGVLDPERCGQLDQHAAHCDPRRGRRRGTVVAQRVTGAFGETDLDMAVAKRCGVAGMTDDRDRLTRRHALSDACETRGNVPVADVLARERAAGDRV